MNEWGSMGLELNDTRKCRILSYQRDFPDFTCWLGWAHYPESHYAQVYRTTGPSLEFSLI